MEKILEFKIDQGQLLQEAAKAKQAILETREEVAELNKAYKDGSLSVEDYAKESVRLEGNLKKEQQTYNNLTRAVNTNSNSLDAQRQKLAALTRQRSQLDRSTAEGVKNFDKLTKEIKKLNTEIGEAEKKGGDFRRSVGDYKNAITDASKEINVAGTSVGGLGAKLASFANPATAAVAIVGAFVAVLARGRQAQELFAQASAFSGGVLDTLTKDLTRFVTTSGETVSTWGKVGKVFADTNPVILLTKANIEALDFITGGYITTLKEAGKEAANFEAQLQKVRIANLTDARESAVLLRDAQILKAFADDEKNSLQDRLVAVRERVKMEERRLELINVGTIQELIVVQAEIERIGRQNASIALLEREAQLYTSIAQTGQTSFTLRNEVAAQERKITTALEAQLKLAQGIARAERRAGPGVDLTIESLQDVADVEIQIETDTADQRLRIRERLNKDISALNKQQAKQEEEQAAQSRAFAEAQQQARLESAAAVSAALTGIFEDGSEVQKAFALFSIGVDTAAAIASLTAASEANPTNAVTFGGAGVAQFAAGLVRILSNIAAAKQYIGSFAAGGHTGPGYGVPDRSGFKVAGFVHEHEYVTPKKVAQSPSAQPHISALEKMRLRGYADGGVAVAQSDTSSINQSLAMVNALKNMPTPEVSVKEITKVARRVAVKETISRR